VKVPPKKTQEQIEQERQIKRDGFQSTFWRVLDSNIQEEIDARYRLLPGIKSIDDLRKVQGEITAFEQILGFAAPYLTPIR